MGRLTGARRPRAVLLDALGTLLRLEDPVAPLRRGLRERCGVQAGEARARAALAAEIAFYREHNLEGSDPASLLDLRRRCADVLREALGPAAEHAPGPCVMEALLGALRFVPYPDAPPALERMRAAGLRLVVVSNWDVSLHDRLAETGLAARVDAAVASAEVGVAKPGRAPFARALALVGVAAGDAVHVGDSPVEDVKGARAAGIEPLLLVRGVTGARDGAPAAGTIRSLEEAADRLA